MGYHSHSFGNEYKNFIKYVFYAVAVIGLLITVLTAIALCDISRMSAYTYDSVNKIPKNRTGLVLGTSKYLTTGGLNDYFVFRIQAATELYKAGKIDYIVVSGDNAHRSYNEPRLMRRELIANGVPRERIYLDYAGFRTLDSVIRISRIFRQNHITIISQDFHNERAIYIARHFGIDAIGFNARNKHSSFFTENVREIIARLRCIFDIYVLNSKPRFLGDTIEIGAAHAIDPKHAQLHDNGATTKSNNENSGNANTASNPNATDKTGAELDTGAANNTASDNTEGNTEGAEKDNNEPEKEGTDNKINSQVSEAAEADRITADATKASASISEKEQAVKANQNQATPNQANRNKKRKRHHSSSNRQSEVQTQSQVSVPAPAQASLLTPEPNKIQ